MWKVLLFIGRQFCEGPVVMNGDAEQCELSLQLTQLVVPIMRNSIALEDSALQAVICCELLLGCMLQPAICQTVACQLADTGKSSREACSLTAPVSLDVIAMCEAYIL